MKFLDFGGILIRKDHVISVTESDTGVNILYGDVYSGEGGVSATHHGKGTFSFDEAKKLLATRDRSVTTNLDD